MTAPDTNANHPAGPLTDALRTVRIEEAERTGVVVALREAAEQRLAILRDRLGPSFAELPRGIDLFDIGLTPGETPRLWIDMIAFVEMGRDRRTYRFLQDTRNGRIVLAESENPALVADRITRYMARRLIERERLLALPPVPAEETHPPEHAPVAGPPAVAAKPTGTPTETAPGTPPPAALASAEAGPSPAAVARLVSATAPPDAAQGAPPETGGPAEPPLLPLSRNERARLGPLAGLVLFLIGVAAGAGGLLAVAQILSRY